MEGVFSHLSLCDHDNNLGLSNLLIPLWQRDTTWVVFVFSDLQFDELLALLEDLDGLLHGAVLHPDVVDGQQLVAQLQRPRPGKGKQNRVGNIARLNPV